MYIDTHTQRHKKKSAKRGKMPKKTKECGRASNTITELVPLTCNSSEKNKYIDNSF